MTLSPLRGDLDFNQEVQIYEFIASEKIQSTVNYILWKKVKVYYQDLLNIQF